MSKEAYVHLVVLSLQDFGWPVAKTFHFGPNQVMAGALPRNTEKTYQEQDATDVISSFTEIVL